MEHTVEVLESIPEFEGSRSELDNFQNELEALLMPKLKEAFANHASDAVIEFIDICEKINRKDQVLHQYKSSRKMGLVKFWQLYDDSTHTGDETNPEADEQAKAKLFVEWLPKFYDELLLILDQEKSWCANVFPHNHDNMVAMLLIDTLNSLKTSFRNRMTNATSSLDHLIPLYTITQSFAKNVIVLLTGAEQALQTQLLMAIFDPFVEYQNAYPKIQKATLHQSMQKIKQNIVNIRKSSSSSSYVDSIRSIDDSIAYLFVIAEQSVDNCMKFTNGTECVGLIQSLSDIFVDFGQFLVSTLVDLDKLVNRNTSSNSNTPANDDNSTVIQGGLELLITSVRLVGKLRRFERSLANRLKEVNQDILDVLAGISSSASSSSSSTSSSSSQSNTLTISEQSMGDLDTLSGCLHLWMNKSGDKKIPLLRGLLQRLTESAHFNHLSSAARQFENYNDSVRSFVLDVMVRPMRGKLITIPSMPTWNVEEEDNPLGLPTFDPVTSSYITNVGEDLMEVPEQLVHFAQTGDQIIQQTALDSMDSSQINDKSLLTAHRFNIMKLMVPLDTDLEFEEADVTGEQDDMNDAEGGEFAFHWLESVCKAVTRVFIERILLIQRLSAPGCRQLAEDIGYFGTVLSAIGVPEDPVLMDIHALVNCSRNEFANTVNQCEAIDATRASVIAKIRGVELDH
eukprot:TRINITY_DN115_c2_g1_i2.p1 TRINITY_DN115_c2_g1~~TRINITY_DN115_c2_g1_i2.p1  ORF type:complete len:682 (-),score=219.77 TRINITY_DN115_c2_g1_i2:467-2512(-)